MKIVTLRMMGGFGNQLFQYAFYDYLHNNNVKVLLDTSHYAINKS